MTETGRGGENTRAAWVMWNGVGDGNRTRDQLIHSQPL